MLSVKKLDTPLDSLAEEALEWLVQLHSGEASLDDWAGYDAWKAKDADRRAAAAWAEKLWAGLGPAAQRPSAATAKSALVGAVVAVALVMGAVGTRISGPPETWLADHRTGIGGHRSVILEDGSRLELDAATGVDVAFSAQTRRLILRSGAIHVAVSPDPARPFEVEAAGGATKALGTAFDVRSDGRDVRVVVTEHAVQVTYPDGNDAPVRVAAGEQIAYGPAHGLGQAGEAAVSATAWHRGRLVFDGMPLGAVVAEMERYRPGLILIADSDLRALPVTGVFDTHDGEGLLDAIAAILPVKVQRLPGLAIIKRVA